MQFVIIKIRKLSDSNAQYVKDKTIIICQPYIRLADSADKN